MLILSFLMLLALNLPAVPVYFSVYWPFAVKHAATSFRAFCKRMGCQTQRRRPAILRLMIFALTVVRSEDVIFIVAHTDISHATRLSSLANQIPLSSSSSSAFSANFN